MLKRVLCAVVAAVTACAGEAAAQWRYSSERDKFDDTKTSFAQVTKTSGVDLGALFVRCKAGSLEAYFSPDDYLGDDGVDVRYRVDSGEVEEEVWSTSTKGTAVFSPFPSSFGRELAAGSRIVIEANDFRGTANTWTFSLSGSGAAIARVFSDCGVPIRDPRLLDERIWRRVVTDVDSLGREHITHAKLLLQQQGFLADSDASSSTRDTGLYVSASRFYQSYWAACKSGKVLSKACETYRTLREVDQSQDYTVEVVELLVEVSSQTGSAAAQTRMHLHAVSGDS